MQRNKIEVGLLYVIGHRDGRFCDVFTRPVAGSERVNSTFIYTKQLAVVKDSYEWGFFRQLGGVIPEKICLVGQRTVFNEMSTGEVMLLKKII